MRTYTRWTTAEKKIIKILNRFDLKDKEISQVFSTLTMYNSEIHIRPEKSIAIERNRMGVKKKGVKKWNVNMIHLLKSRFDMGWTDKEISRELTRKNHQYPTTYFRKSVNSVKKMRRKLGLSKKYFRPRKWTYEKDLEAHNLRRYTNLSDEEIAEKLGVTKTALRSRLYKTGLHMRPPVKRDKPSLQYDDITKAVEEYGK